MRAAAPRHCATTRAAAPSNHAARTRTEHFTYDAAGRLLHCRDERDTRALNGAARADGRFDARDALVQYPASGRYLTPDPLGIAGTMTLYDYAAGNR